MVIFERAGGSLRAFLLFGTEFFRLIQHKGTRMIRLLMILLTALFASPLLAKDLPRLGVFGVVQTVLPLVVSGQEIILPPDVPVISPLGLGQTIGTGDTLAIRVKMDQGVLTATRVLLIYPIIGPVSAVQGNTATIMGSPAHVPPDTNMEVGTWVALSGFWSGEKIITTKVRVIKRNGFGHITGVVSNGEVALGGTALRGAQVPLEGFQDHIWMFSGAPEDAGLRVRLIAKGIFGGEIDLALWQGHASLPIASQTYTIHGTGLIGTAADAQMPDAGTLITRCGYEGRFVDAAPSGMEAEFAALGCVGGTLAD